MPAPGAFGRFWTAGTLSAMGTALTAVALPVLLVDVLGADTLQVGIVNAAQFVPYAVLGLLAGVWVDRWRRRPTLVIASLGRAAALAAIPVLWVLGLLDVWILAALMLVFGAFSVFGFAASQSLLPRIVPRQRLLTANARLDQGEAAAQTVGPTLGGALVGWLGAPLTIALDAVTYVVDAVLVATIRMDEKRMPRQRRRLAAEAMDGLRATYRHPSLGPLAVSTHVWFVANAAALTILAVLALRTMAFGPILYGLLFTVVGATALMGASLASGAGARFGQGPVIIAGRAAYPVAWALVSIAPALDRALGIGIVFVALALHGLAGGLENANELSYRQLVTPDELLGRVSATMRSANRTMAVVGAVGGGAVATWAGDAVALAAVIVLFAAALLIGVLSPLRTARA
ncbi:MAG TPA: MFS transporter [Microbacterium sp.]|nr:MFS transporter [Microbacterium sp.]